MARAVPFRTHCNTALRRGKDGRNLLFRVDHTTALPAEIRREMEFLDALFRFENRAVRRGRSGYLLQLDDEDISPPVHMKAAFLAAHDDFDRPVRRQVFDHRLYKSCPGQRPDRQREPPPRVRELFAPLEVGVNEVFRRTVSRRGDLPADRIRRGRSRCSCEEYDEGCQGKREASNHVKGLLASGQSYSEA